eukprot:9232813-Pyramimonas_sp.AAC.1
MVGCAAKANKTGRGRAGRGKSKTGHDDDGDDDSPAVAADELPWQRTLRENPEFVNQVIDFTKKNPFTYSSHAAEM